jgi:hypothetical protein
MEKKPTGKPNQPIWRGDEVADAPPGEAEAAADRAAGRTPDRHQGEGEAPTDPAAPPTERMSSEEERENQERKREAAAEDHAADKKTGGGTAPRNL